MIHNNLYLIKTPQVKPKKSKIVLKSSVLLLLNPHNRKVTIIKDSRINSLIREITNNKEIPINIEAKIVHNRTKFIGD